jgi:uncharacterized protein (TIGR03905 family)
MKHQYATKGTCSTRITFDLEDGKVRGIAFADGCDGNLKGLSLLADGMDARELIAKLKGLRCGRKKTSCPDQLAKAVEIALAAGSLPECSDCS